MLHGTAVKRQLVAMDKQGGPVVADIQTNGQLPIISTKHVCLHFRLPFWTTWGQSLVVSGDGKVLGDWDPLQGLRMSCHHAGEELIWEAQVSVPHVRQFSYRYVLMDESTGEVKREVPVRTVQLYPDMAHDERIGMWDEWNLGGDLEQMFATSAFTDAIFRSKDLCDEPITNLQHVLPEPGHVVLQFSVSSHRVLKGQIVVVTGSSHQLGNWQPHQAVELSRTGTSRWQGEVKVPVGQLPVTYKYAIRDKRSNAMTMKLERGESRMASASTGECNHPSDPHPAVLVRHDGYLQHAEKWKGAGVAVPVFSLRTRRSIGVGEFRDIRALVDVCRAAGFHMAQLLPVNDTSVYMGHRPGTAHWDSYPYCSLSVFALHPQYLCLDALTASMPSEIRSQIDAARVELDKEDVDYPAVMATKRNIARRIFELKGNDTFKSADYKAFWEDHKDWLKPYAVFCLLRDIFGTSEHWRWGKLAAADWEDINRLAAPGTEHHQYILFTYYLQFHLHSQLLDASRYSAQNGVALKGDLPIGVDKRSVDTWLHPKLFRMTKSTGAPPDFFDPNGQNWGFPTYVWEEMAKDGYGWWRARLAHMAQYFHAYRIDHILGFFRIWENPGDAVTAALGTFRPAVALNRWELEAAGVWDFHRLTRPYVRSHILLELFGEAKDEIVKKYLREDPPGSGSFVFLEGYQSEKAIMEGLEGVEDLDVRRGLSDLLKSVILLQDEHDEKKFYPRFGMDSTRSWTELDEHHRNSLARLCEDFFHGRQEALWERHALRTLPILMGATRMLVFGEDLGFVPACVPPILDGLGLFGLRIQRMSAEPDQEFGDPSKYPYMTVASPSCHDTTTLRGWWEEDAERREKFYKAFGESGPAPDTCTEAVARLIFKQHIESSSCWVVFPIQDVLAMSQRYTTRPALEETINDPTNPKHYWRYRMHVNLEDIASDTSLMKSLSSLLESAGRCDG